MQSPRGTLLRQYRYDALDRLIADASPNEPVSQYFYCKNRLTTKKQGAMRYSIVQHSDQLLAQHRSEGDALDTTLLATDQQRSVLDTLKTNHLRQSIAYTPHGYRPVSSGLLSPLGFNGERADSLTGCYVLGNGYRTLNPVLMRFTSSDRLSPFGEGGVNSYAYCFGDPVNWSDQTGLSPIFTSLMLFVESRTIPSINPGEFLTLNKNINRNSAIDFLSTFKSKQQIETSKLRLQSAFKNDYNAIINPINTSPSSLKALAQNSILKQNLPTDALPTALRAEVHPQQYKKLMDMLVDQRDLKSRMLSEGRLQALPAEIQQSKDPIFKKIATSYRNEMLAIRSPEQFRLQSIAAKKIFADSHKIL